MRSLPDGPAFGCFVTIPAEETVEAIAWAGYDFVVVDTEHSLTSHAQVARLIRAAESAGIACLVRVPSGDYASALRCVEFGASGILAPHVRSADDARALVAAVKYRPTGDRGIDPFTRATGYGSRPLLEHIAATNRDVTAICIIEDREGVDNIEEILSVEGVNGVFLGPSDLARSYGVTGNVDHPKVEAAITTVTERTLARDLLLGRAGYDSATVVAALRSGARLVVSPAVDAAFLRSALASHLGDIRRAAGLEPAAGPAR
jgi:2-keto-3-deoxy-L-rhamnonate aldolase RhmA